MPNTIFPAVAMVALVFSDLGCAHKTEHEIAAEAVSDRYVSRHVRPLSDPVARLAHKGLPIPAELVSAGRVTLIEVMPGDGESQLIFEDQTIRPPNSGMITGVPNAQRVGLYYPANLAQPDVEIRVNYQSDFDDGWVAVHVVAPNPLTLKENEK